MLYSQTDLSTVNKQLTLRVILAAALLLVPVGAAVAIMLTTRQQWLSFLLSAVGVSAMIFYVGVIMSPLLCYRRFLKEVFDGRSHGATVRFLRAESDSVREGVSFYTLYFAGDAAEELLLYLDKEKQNPFAEGETYEITTHGQAIIGIGD